MASDEILQLPEKYVVNSCGFALDIGSSVAKLTSRSKADYHNGKPLRDFGKYKDGQPIGQVHLTMIKREKLDEVIDFIKNYCDITLGEDGVSVNTTGMGGNLFRTRLEEELNVKTKNSFESDCFVKALHFLRGILPPSSFFTKVPTPAVDVGLDMIPQPDKSGGQDWPVLLVICGSGTWAMLIHEDGSHSFDADDLKGGRFFLGVSRLITGLENFQDFIAMAEKGRVLDGGFSSIKVEDEVNTLKNKEPEVDEHQFQNLSIGNSKNTADQLRPEDMVRSFLHRLISDISTYVGLITKRYGIFNPYFVGSLVNNKLVQEMITKEIQKHNAGLTTTEHKINFEFIRNGGHLGSIGAYLLDNIKLSL